MHLTAAKVLLALLLVMPYCLFRFAASFRQPSLVVRALAVAVTVGIVVFTFTLQYLPLPGFRPAAALARLPRRVPGPVHLPVRLRRRPPLHGGRRRAARSRRTGCGCWRWRWPGLQVQVVVAALQLHGTTTALITEAITVVMGILFLVALVLPSFVRVALSRREDVAFRQAVGELVSAGDSKDVGDRLLPHVCALVGASKAALLTSDGTVVARYPMGADGDGSRRMGLRTTTRTTTSTRATTDHRAHPQRSTPTCSP